MVLGFVRWWTARIEQVPDACLYGWCKLLLRELNKQTYYYVLMFQIIRVLAHTLFIFIILIYVLIFFLFSIFRACCNHCFVLWRHTQFHLTVFSSVFLWCAVQFVQ